MNPVGQDACARRIAHALAILVQDDDDTHEENEHRGEVGAAFGSRDERADIHAEAKGEVGHGTQEQAQGHHYVALDAVYHITIDEARRSVYEGAEKQYPAEALVGNAILTGQARHGKREVLSHEIKHGVTEHRHQNGACLPIDEFLAFLAQAAVDVLLCAHINFSFFYLKWCRIKTLNKNQPMIDFRFLMLVLQFETKLANVFEQSKIFGDKIVII